MANKSLDGALIKKAHVKQQWTESQITDMLADGSYPIYGLYSADIADIVLESKKYVFFIPQSLIGSKT